MGFLKLDNVQYCGEDFHSEIYARCNPELGDVLLTKDGASTGNVAVNELDEPFSLLSSVCLLKPDPEKLCAKFLMYYLQSRDGFQQVTGKMTGAAIKRIILKNIKSSVIPVPSICDQKKISSLLDETFDGIDTVGANTEKNLANVRELFDGYLSSVFAQRGDGWVDQPLKDVCVDYGRGKSKHRPRNDPKLYGGDYPFIQTGDVRKSSQVIKDYSATYNDVGLAQSKLWPEGTICITIAANIAETGMLGFDACFPDSIIGMVVDEKKASKEYVEYLLQSVKTVLKAKGKGSAQDNINLGTFEKEKFPFPPIDKQQEIAASLDELSSTVSSLEVIYQQKLTALAELKQSLLQKAFSGELTASEAEAAVEEATA